MSLVLVEFLILVGVLAGIVIWGVRPTGDVDAAHWAERSGISLSASSPGLVERYLMWTRRWRMAGVFLGVLAFGKWILLDRMDQPQPGIAPWLILPVAGYLIGAIAAEITLHGIHGIDQPAVSSASLEERRPDMYVPRSASLFLWVVPVLCIALVPTYVVVADQPHIHSRLGIVAAAGFGALALAVAVWWMVRHVVVRPQPVVSDELHQVDNAMRATSLQIIVAAGVALELILLSVATSELKSALEARYQHSWPEVISIVTVGSLVLALISWFMFSHPRSARGTLAPVSEGER